MGFFKKFRRPKAQLLLSVRQKELTFGEQLEGDLKVSSQELLDVKSIDVSLSCLETMKKTRRYQEVVEVQGERYSVYDARSWDMDSKKHYRPSTRETVWQEEDYWDGAELFSDSKQLDKQIQVNLDFDKTYPFSIKLPSIGRCTYHSVNNNVRWTVQAEMKIIGRHSVSSNDEEIQVGEASGDVKEVVREVVLIPCAYCRGLMPQTALFCPHCGARRTA